MVDRVKDVRRGHSRISSKNQITIPAEALSKAGLRKGDRVKATAQATGKILLVREEDPIDAHAGALTGVYRDSLKEFRKEWRR
ncbi:MAG: AbrB/MazE/SpoVT family DNA-binding domain-containing protein [Actinobacteria bacterium]|nr:AbrB/MazE/SpoVT family DNA-binding domain-containing protein [Actinomycetota bacterium]